MVRQQPVTQIRTVHHQWSQPASRIVSAGKTDDSTVTRDELCGAEFPAPHGNDRQAISRNSGSLIQCSTR